CSPLGYAQRQCTNYFCRALARFEQRDRLFRGQCKLTASNYYTSGEDDASCPAILLKILLYRLVRVLDPAKSSPTLPIKIVFVQRVLTDIVVKVARPPVNWIYGEEPSQRRIVRACAHFDE